MSLIKYKTLKPVAQATRVLQVSVLVLYLIAPSYLIDKFIDPAKMLTYAQVEQALHNLQYVVDFDLRYHAKLTALIPVDGYQSEIALEFREECQSALGNCDELLHVEWLMDDGENCLTLDHQSLNIPDEVPHLFVTEKIILRRIFEDVLREIEAAHH